MESQNTLIAVVVVALIAAAAMWYLKGGPFDALRDVNGRAPANAFQQHN